ncbi:hypothetical protein Clacol_007551 [Clathrus columnatus]|uniref:Uncharacterized protein n=1 Tax=Clathrus columnatus TaxID=1419009 RepID=A0AAV5AKS5_9AGAM|nr:hypothetical protein Clacol_007551 [Clathrus columnatus]
MIAFDQRNAGRTKSQHSGRRDSYVDAADLAFALELLQIPPVHIFAVQLNSIWSACRFSLLFPSKCLSLCLCGVPADEPLDWVKKAFMDLVEIWAFPTTLEVYEEAILEMSYFMWSGVAEWWMINSPPAKRRTVLELSLCILPQYIGITHRVFLDFLCRQPAVPPFTPGKPDVLKMAKDALHLLADLKGDPSISQRDPSTPLSFSMWSEEVAEAFQAQIDEFGIGIDKVFSPLDANGQPIRKFSSRHDDEWSSDHFAVLRETVKNLLQGVKVETQAVGQEILSWHPASIK